jgi:hypothetical protein
MLNIQTHSCISTPIKSWTHVYMNSFTRNSPYYSLLKYLLFLLKHPVNLHWFVTTSLLRVRNEALRAVQLWRHASVAHGIRNFIFNVQQSKKHFLKKALRTSETPWTTHPTKRRHTPRDLNTEPLTC